MLESELKLELSGLRDESEEELRQAAVAIERVRDDLRKAGKIRRVFVDAIDRARADRAEGQGRLPFAADHDHRGPVAARGEGREDLQAVQIGHAEIEQNDIEGFAGEGGEAGGAGVDRRDDRGAVGFKEKRDDPRDLGIIVGMQHAQGRLPGRCRHGVERWERGGPGGTDTPSSAR